MKRPLVPVALLFAAGIICADWVELSCASSFAAAGAVGILALAVPRNRVFLLATMLVLAGAANHSSHTAILAPNDLRLVVGDIEENTSIRGTLTETPYHRVYGGDNTPTVRTLAFLDVHDVLIAKTNWIRVTGQVVVSTTGLLSNVFGGQLVQVQGQLARPRLPSAEGLFNYRAYLKRQGIHYQMYSASSNDWQVLWSPAQPPLADRFCAWAQQTLARGLPEVDEPLQLLWAMTLGWKTALSGEVAEPFMRSGTMHVFAISGLHIALIAAILVKLLRVLGVPRALCGVLIIPAIWLYTGLTGWQASAIRATIMSTVIIAGWSIKRPSDLVNSLAASGLLILLWDPQQLFQASFQLSFVVVLSLAVVGPFLIHYRDLWLNRWLRYDPYLPESLVPGWRKNIHAIARPLSAAIITSLASWLGSIPLVAYYFHLWTPGSVFANLIIVPLSSLALISNMASLFVGAWFPACAELFNHSAWFFMVAMVRLSEWFAWLPSSCFHVKAPGPLLFLFYYSALFCIVLGIFQRATPQRRKLAACIGLAVLALACLVQWGVANVGSRMTILPVQGGHAVFLHANMFSKPSLIDCGHEEAVKYTTQPFLKAQGVNSMGRFFLTHGDARHIGGTELICKSFSTPEIVLSPLRFRSSRYRAITATLTNTPGLTRYIELGDRLGPWKVLHPGPEDRFARADDASMVLSGSFQGVTVLLLSDLGRPGQIKLAERYPDLRADIVVAGLPDQGEPLADGLLALIQPKLIIVADSHLPATARASKPLRERLARQRAPVVYTSDSGALTLRLQNKSWDIKSLATRLGTNP